MTERPFSLKHLMQVPRNYIAFEHPMIEVTTPPIQLNHYNILPHIMLNPLLKEQKRVSDEEAIRPAASLAYATRLAQRDVNGLRTSVGLDSLTEKEMKVLYIPQEKYHALSRYMGLLPDDAPAPSEAHSSEFSDEVLVNLSDQPNYYLGAASYHELIHTHLQLGVGAWVVQPYRHQPGSEIYYMLKRKGAAVSLSDPKNDCKSTLEYRGMLLNEVANFGFMGQYINDRLHNNEFAFADEIAQRNEYFSKHPLLSGPEDSIGFPLKFSDGSSKTVGLRKDWFTVGKDGKFTRDLGGPLFMQLATDLADMTGPVDGIPFLQYLLLVGLNPRLQPKLREVMDSKLGDGFYTRLKRTPYDGDSDEFRQLFVDVQSKKYIIE